MTINHLHFPALLFASVMLSVRLSGIPGPEVQPAEGEEPFYAVINSESAALDVERALRIEFDTKADGDYQVLRSDDGMEWMELLEQPVAGSGGSEAVHFPVRYGVGLLRVRERNPVVHRPRDDADSGLPHVEGLRLHLDASDSGSLVLDGDSVEEWHSTLDDPIVFKPPDSGSPPTLSTGAVNGRAAVTFGSYRFLETTSPAALGMTNDISGFTAFAVGWNTGSGSQNYFRIGRGEGGSPAGLRVMLGRQTDRHRMLARRVDSEGFATVAGGVRRNEEWGIDSGIVDYANARAALHINGVEVASSENFLDPGNTSSTDSRMFRIGTDHADQFWEGDIAEILMYDRVLTQAERDEAGIYLSDKYGIPWTFISEEDVAFDTERGVSLIVDSEVGRNYKVYMTEDLSDWAAVGDTVFGTGRKENFFVSLADRGRAFFRTETAKSYHVVPDGLPNEGRLFVDHEANGRSGHGGNAITEARNGDIVAFYSNVSGDVWGGHSVSGWSEYRISEDGGETWSEPYILDYSMEVWEGDDFHSALVDEVVTAPNGTLVAIAGRYTAYNWRRTTPVYLRSYDNGRTWTGPLEVDPGAGTSRLAREHASLVRDDTIYVLFNGGDRGAGELVPHRLYVSTDNGETFRKRSTLPFDPERWYGAMTVTPEGDLIAYSYLQEDEHNLHYTVSRDSGYTWSRVRTTHLAKRIRNPQVSERVGGLYFMHGRSGHEGDDPRHLVLYASKDGIHWDEGVFLNKGSTSDLDSYSTNEVVGKFDDSSPERLLVQSSVAYDDPGRRVNIHHWFVEFEQ